MEEVKTAGELAQNVPMVKVVDCHAESRGSVRVLDATGQQLNMDPKLQQRFATAADDDGVLAEVLSSTKATAKGKQTQVNRSVTTRTNVRLSVQIRPSTLFICECDKIDAKRCKPKAITSKDGDTFTRVCRMHKLPFEQHGVYRQWLTQQRHVQSIDLPTERRCCVVIPFRFSVAKANS